MLGEISNLLIIMLTKIFVQFMPINIKKLTAKQKYLKTCLCTLKRLLRKIRVDFGDPKKDFGDP
jgi:hypothetical protein